MSDFKTRLQDEKTELQEKLVKLTEFIGTNKFDELGNNQRNLLIIQHSAMKTYVECLKARLDIL